MLDDEEEVIYHESSTRVAKNNGGMIFPFHCKELKELQVSVNSFNNILSRYWCW